MARNNQALLIEALWDETERLTTTVNALQSRLAAHGDSDYATHVLTQTAPTTLQPVEPSILSSPGIAKADEWNVWPYSWARNLYTTAQAYFCAWHPTLFLKWLSKLGNHPTEKHPALKLLH